MTTVAIICEYNPFHNGHKHQIDEIRREFGADTRIIAIMSGNYTQRGLTAISDKSIRAKCAVECGVNLVLELPFPFSSASAELFAMAGVSIANDLGIVDYLSFGSESGSIDEITLYATRTLAPEYTSKLHEMLKSDSYSALGYPTVCEMAYESVYGAEGIKLTPNNILAVEYVRALNILSSKIRPHTIKREGADYLDERIVNSNYQSASAIRKSVLSGDFSALDYMPTAAKKILLSDLGKTFPSDMENLSIALLSFFRLSPTHPEVEIHDAMGGLYNRLRNASFEASNITTLISLTETKKYTNARILRAAWYSFFGVTSSDVKEKPQYTQLLAMDGTGRACLKEIGRRSNLAVLTKPSSYDGLNPTARAQKELSDRADSIFHLSSDGAKNGDYSLKFTPYVKA